MSRWSFSFARLGVVLFVIAWLPITYGQMVYGMKSDVIRRLRVSSEEVEAAWRPRILANTEISDTEADQVAGKIGGSVALFSRGLISGPSIFGDPEANTRSNHVPFWEMPEVRKALISGSATSRRNRVEYGGGAVYFARRIDGLGKYPAVLLLSTHGQVFRPVQVASLVVYTGFVAACIASARAAAKYAA